MDTQKKILFTPTKPAFVAGLLASILFAGVSTFALAQDEEEEARHDSDLEEIIITGTRSGKALNKIPGAVSIISAMEIERDVGLTADVTAMLARTVPGYGQSQQQMARFGENLRGRKALRLLDGVPQGSPLRDGTRDGIFTEMGVIERVEVVNGPSATEGIGASGGIINYITKTPTKMGTEMQFSAQYRSQFETDSQSWRVAFNGMHKADNYDILIGGSLAETGIAYDGDGKTIGISASGSDRDSKSNNLFIKLGTNFGANDEQRIEVSHSRFLLECQCRYSIFDENPDVWNWHEVNEIPITAIKVPPPGSLASFNDFIQTTFSYTHSDLFGGTLFVQAYDASQAMRFESERGLGKQEPEFAPFTLDELGFPVGQLPLVEQSEINSQKQGLRTSWAGDSLFGSEGLGLQIGVDFVEDTAQQKLAIQNRTWVPPMKYSSFAPFAQVSLDIDAFTITGGLRYEDGKLDVDDYVSSWANDRRPVGGGTITYGDLLPNLGAIWRVSEEWSVYASYSKGFTLPNAGIPLRNMRCSNDTSERGNRDDPINQPFGGIQPDGCPNDPAVTVNDIIDLEAIIVDNKEFGFSWNGENGKFGVSLYESTSDFGASLRVDPDIGDWVLARQPTEIQGIEMTGSYDIVDNFRVSALYSHTKGKTNSDSSVPEVLDREMGIIDIPLDKLVVNLDWLYSSSGSIVLNSETSFDRDINEGAGGEEHINGVTLFNLSTNYNFAGGTLSLGITNLLDKTYPLSFSQIVFWKNYMHGRGREVTLGYTATY